MTLLSPIMCKLGRHEPERRKVEWNGKIYVGHCRNCGKKIERLSHRKWQLQKDAEAEAASNA